MSALLSQLMRFSSGTRPWQARPFSLKVKKDVWSIATDGCVLFALRIPGAQPCSSAPKDDFVPLLTTPPKGSVELSVPELKAWAGEAPATIVPCLQTVEYEHHGGLLDKAIDRRKLAYLFATVPFPTVRAWVYEACIVFEGAGGQWRGVLSCLFEPLDGEEPVFAVKKEGPPSVFDVAAEIGSE